MDYAQNCYHPDADIGRAKVDLMAALKHAYGTTPWLVSQALEHPAVRPAALALGDAKGWRVTNATWLGRTLSAMAREGAQLVCETRSGLTFWSLTESQTELAPVPAAQPKPRPSARYAQAAQK